MGKKAMWQFIFIVQGSSSTPFSLPVGMHGEEVCPVQRNTGGVKSGLLALQGLWGKLCQPRLGH